MKFRPCIDIHNGKVKQIVGASLKEEQNSVVENFVSDRNAAYYSSMYKNNGLTGGHIILLNHVKSEKYESTLQEAFEALNEYPYGMQIGGGVNNENAEKFLDAKASHVIVTSFVFKNGKINYDNLKSLVHNIGKEHLVLDLSCKKKDNDYYIVTDRWQKFTDIKVEKDTLDMLSDYCDEFLIHAADVEGKVNGIEKKLVIKLGIWNKTPITYAGGIAGFEDIDMLKKLGGDIIDFTIGSALDIFGGKIRFKDIIDYTRKEAVK